MPQPSSVVTLQLDCCSNRCSVPGTMGTCQHYIVVTRKQTTLRCLLEGHKSCKPARQLPYTTNQAYVLVCGPTIDSSQRSRMSGMIRSTAFHKTCPRCSLSSSYSGLPRFKPVPHWRACSLLPCAMQIAAAASLIKLSLFFAIDDPTLLAQCMLAADMALKAFLEHRGEKEGAKPCAAHREGAEQMHLAKAHRALWLAGRRAACACQEAPARGPCMRLSISAPRSAHHRCTQSNCAGLRWMIRHSSQLHTAHARRPHAVATPL